MTRLGTLPYVRRTVVVLATGLLLATAAGCTSATPTPAPVDPDTVAAPVADTLPGKAPAPADRCHASGNTPAAKVVVTTRDGVHLAGVAFGSGPRGVLLLPQRDDDLCPWWGYAGTLVNQGFHVLALDMRGTGYSEDSSTLDYTADAAAGLAELRRAGATRVMVMGASQGAATALVLAGRAADLVAGVVALSYPDDGLDVTGATGAAPHTPIQAAPTITAPVLLCFTAGDSFARAAHPSQLAAAATRSATVHLVGRPGVSHGWDMLKPGTDDVTADVLSFLQSYS